MDDNSPLDYAARMQDIESWIKSWLAYTNHTNDHDAADCRVCSGQPCRQQRPLHVSYLHQLRCTRCHSLPRCVVCHRHLPATCFPPDSPLCQACFNKQEKPLVRASERNVVTEVTIPTARATQSLEAFLNYNDGVINNIIDDYRRQYRSIRVHFRADAIFVRHTEDGQQQRIPPISRPRLRYRRHAEHLPRDRCRRPLQPGRALECAR